MKARTMLLIVAMSGAALVTLATPASANVHFMSIREVFGGSVAAPNARFVELQMYSSGQTFTTGSQLVFENGSGSEIRTLALTNNVSNGQNQRTVLIGTPDISTAFPGVAPDFATMASSDILPAGGAVCFQAPGHGIIDCVSWGAISGAPPEAGSPAPAIPSGQSIERDITAGCATQVEASDDTDNSANDFATVTPNPEPNAQAPNETACSGGGGGGQGGDPAVTVQNLKTKTPGSKAVISGAISPADPGTKVKVTLFAKGSPFEKVGKKKDTLSPDSRFKVKIGVPGDARRCKATVKYNGQVEATKKFAC
jgi:hypothetical protein